MGLYTFAPLLTRPSCPQLFSAPAIQFRCYPDVLHDLTHTAVPHTAPLQDGRAVRRCVTPRYRLPGTPCLLGGYAHLRFCLSPATHHLPLKFTCTRFPHTPHRHFPVRGFATAYATYGLFYFLRTCMPLPSAITWTTYCYSPFKHYVDSLYRFVCIRGACTFAVLRPADPDCWCVGGLRFPVPDLPVIYYVRRNLPHLDVIVTHCHPRM